MLGIKATGATGARSHPEQARAHPELISLPLQVMQAWVSQATPYMEAPDVPGFGGSSIALCMGC